MTNDTRITRDMVVANNLVDRYLLGQMDEAEAMAFEDFYAGDPDTLDELETSAQLIDSMKAELDLSERSSRIADMADPVFGPEVLASFGSLFAAIRNEAEQAAS